MSSPLTGLTSLIPKIVSLLDLNINQIEKIENRYRLQRKLSSITVFSFIYILLISISLSLNYYLHSMIYTLLFFELVILTVIGIILVKIEKPKPKPSYKTGLILVCFLNNWFITITVYIIYETISNFDISYIFVVLISIFLEYMCSYALYKMIADFIKTKIKSYTLLIHLTSSERLLVKLLSITPKGDYIVEVLDNSKYEKAEVLLNRMYIEKVIYLPEKQSNEDNFDSAPLVEK